MTFLSSLARILEFSSPLIYKCSSSEMRANSMADVMIEAQLHLEKTQLITRTRAVHDLSRASREMSVEGTRSWLSTQGRYVVLG
jgi:hypothetical protein